MRGRAAGRGTATRGLTRHKPIKINSGNGELPSEGVFLTLLRFASICNHVKTPHFSVAYRWMQLQTFARICPELLAIC
jgi:hypothetical protein